MPQNHLVSRKKFLNLVFKGSVGAYLASIIYPVIHYMIPPKLPEAAVSNVLIGKVSDFPPNKGAIFKFGRKPGLIIRTKDGQFRAFIATCTHLDCTVQYRDDLGVIWCACHNGKYDLNGKNISGPPPKPLTSLVVHLKGEDIYISKTT